MNMMGEVIPLFFFNKKKTVVISKKAETEINEVNFKGLTWIDITRPGFKEIEFLRERFDFHELLLEDCMSENQRSKIDDYEDYVFLVLHFPRYKKDIGRLVSEEIDIFMSKNYLVTLHEGELKPLVRFLHNMIEKEEYKEKYMTYGSSILLSEILRRLFDYCFPMLDKIGTGIDNIQKEIFKNRSLEIVQNISRIKLQVINYRKIMKPLRPVILSLEKLLDRYIPEDMEIYFEDISDKVEKIWDLLENYKEVIDSMQATHESLTSYGINKLMTFFTVISAIVLPMTFISGLFSMNVQGIPLSSIHNSFWIVSMIVFIPSVFLGTYIYLKKNEWF